MQHTFKSFGDFAATVRAAALRDTKAQRAISTFSSGINGPDGGYAIPTDFAEQIFMVDQDSLAARCEMIPSLSRNIDVPTDGSMPWSSTGIIAHWIGAEGTVHTPRKPELSLAEHKLKPLVVLVPASKELVEDSMAFNAWLPTAMQRAITWELNDAIINGTGAGVPLGILKSSAAIEVAKETSQTAATINDGNITKMLARSLEPMKATWVASPVAYSQLVALSSFDSATRTLAGLPIVLTDACAAVGTVGDLVLAGLNGYRVVSKALRFAESAHMSFDEDLHMFRVVLQVDGQPILPGPVTPPNSATTRSHFVTVATRA
jgi:HK97 family phage major capsid protein